MNIVIWDPKDHTDEENVRWCLLRALEWQSWPLFLSVLYAPILFVLIHFWYVILGILIVDILWKFVVGYNINIVLAGMGVLLVGVFKWIICVMVSIFLILRGQIPLAVVVITWPIIGSAIVMFLEIPFSNVLKTGIMQEKFMNKLGYAKVTSPDKSASVARKF